MCRIVISLIALVSVFGTELIAGRLGTWCPERMPGSSRLELESIRYVVVPVDAEASLLAAVEDLRQLFSERLGVAPEILVDDSGYPKNAIFLSKSFSKSHSSGAFMIRRERTRVFISAGSTEGVVNGVYALCSDLLGARWYWPGEIGLEFIGEAQSKFPEHRWREAPSYVMRSLYPVDADFSRRNRLVKGFQFNHALAKVFSPAVYDVEPEVFAVVNGVRRKPRGHGGVDPQPDFTQQRTVTLAAEAVLAHFEEHPNSQSFSLSINDNVLFDQSDSTREIVEPIEYFRGRPNYTDLVFGFMNEVAVKVFDEGDAWTTPTGEPRYLTALAYYWTEQSPSFKLHPRVMPVLTSDRAQWHDPEYRESDKALIKRWAASGAERIATWDYYFGAPYPYPRQFNEWIAESLAFMNEQGVTVFYSQMPSACGMDGAKAWLAARLLWDASEDAEQLLEEYYVYFFGAAAEPIRSFYELAEAHRNANEGKADWIKFYKDEAGIELFDAEVLADLRGLIGQAEVAVMDDPRRRERVAVVSEAFEFTEAYARNQRARARLVECALNVLSSSQVDDSSRVDELEALLNDYREAQTASSSLLGALIKNPLHSRLGAFRRAGQSDPSALALAAMAQAGRRLVYAEGESVAALAKVAQRWADQDGAFRPWLSNPDLVRANEPPRERNFLGPTLPRVYGWHFDFRPAEHLAVGAAVGVAARGVRVAGADVFSIFRDIPVVAGESYLLDAQLAYRISADNRTKIKLRWTGQNDRKIRTDTLLQLPREDSDGARRVVFPLRAPKDAYGLRILFTVSRQAAGDFLELEKVALGLIVD